MAEPLRYFAIILWDTSAVEVHGPKDGQALTASSESGWPRVPVD